jgi:trypsin
MPAMTHTQLGNVALLATIVLCIGGVTSISEAAGADDSTQVMKAAPSAAVNSESANHRAHAAGMIIRRLGLSAYRSTFGGFSYSEAGTHLDIHLTALDPAIERSLLAAVPADDRSSISFVPTTVTEQQLDAVQQAITDDIDFLSGSEHLTIAAWSPDYIAGKNLISLVNPTAAQLGYLQERYGATVQVDSVSGLPVGDASRISDHAPWHGGDFISDGRVDCTSGLGMHNPAGQQFMVTAAHCFAQGNDVYNAAVSIGFGINLASHLGSVYARDTRSAGNDAELIPTSASSYMWVSGTSTTTAVSLDPAYDWVGQGTPVCLNGAFEGVHCSGTTGTEGCINLISTYPTRFVCNEVAVSGTDNQMVGSGDSGGPVYIKDVDSHDYIVGIFSASNGTVACTNWHTQQPARQCGPSGYYADISTIAQLWSLNVNN